MSAVESGDPHTTGSDAAVGSGGDAGTGNAPPADLRALLFHQFGEVMARLGRLEARLDGLLLAVERADRSHSSQAAHRAGPEARQPADGSTGSPAEAPTAEDGGALGATSPAAAEGGSSARAGLVDPRQAEVAQLRLQVSNLSSLLDEAQMQLKLSRGELIRRRVRRGHRRSWWKVWKRRGDRRR